MDNFQNFSDVQDSNMISVSTIASAPTINPRTKTIVLTGIVEIVTINPPVPGFHELNLILADDYGGLPTFDNTGNISLSINGKFSGSQGSYVKLIYNPITRKYYFPSAVSFV